MRKSGWSVTSPCGAVSYTDEAASTSTPCSAERVARGAQVREPVSHVGAEPEVARQTSFHTSTETSSTGSGIGGSGLVAFTRTDSAPKRSIRRSATAAQRRSSVL